MARTMEDMTAGYVVVEFTVGGKQRRSRIPATSDVEAAKARVLAQFPDAQITSATPHIKDAEASPPEAKPTTTPELAKTPVAPERVQASAANQPASPPDRHAVKPPEPRVPMRGTQENDARVMELMPTLGDSVHVNVELVPFMRRKDVHEWLIIHGVHDAYGVVAGIKVEGGFTMFLVETGTHSVWVPHDAIERSEPPPQKQAMQDATRSSPERMRKPGPGSYNLT